MSVHWSLKGMCVHNVTVALCMAGPLHKDLTLAQRAECSLSGFICLDLFRILSERKANELGLPRGACFMARQTVATLQAAALNSVAMAVSKSPTFSCWETGFGRISELPIEQNFGHLRRQSSSGKLTTRSFFLASARQAQRTGKALNHCKPKVPRVEAPLTDSELLGHYKLHCDEHMLGCYPNLPTYIH